jgi:hypothetical protein
VEKHWRVNVAEFGKEIGVSVKLEKDVEKVVDTLVEAYLKAIFTNGSVFLMLVLAIWVPLLLLACRGYQLLWGWLH